MIPTRIISRAKTIIGDKMGSTSYTDPELMEFFNDMVDGLVADVRMGFPEFGGKSTTISQASGTFTNTAPTDLESLLSLRTRSATSNEVTAEMFPVDIHSITDYGFAFTYEGAWKINWVNTNQTKDWTLFYTYAPVRCHKGVAQTITDSSITLADNAAITTVGTVEHQDDYYNNATLIITDATTATKEWQTWTISDYVGATGVATVDWASGTKPDGTVTYEILPLIDCNKFQALLSWELANTVMAVDRGQIAVYPANHPYRVAQRRFSDYWNNLQRRMSESMRGVNREYV